jgi:hypothetical protein
MINLSITLRRAARYVRRKARAVYGRTLWPVISPFKRRILFRRTGLKVHLGCGDDHFEGFVNIDERFTPATDVTMNLSRPSFRPGSVRVCFSHAFFEHLYRRDQVPHLRAVRDALEPGGVVCYLGLPDFANIARFYLERRPGIVGPVFDLFEVYRYTHGDPERVTWFVGQLHKSLFDRGEVARLLREARFEHFALFSYCYGGERLAVNLGFYAIKGELLGRDLCAECREFLRPWAGSKVELGTVCFFDESSDAGTGNNGAPPASGALSPTGRTF